MSVNAERFRLIERTAKETAVKFGRWKTLGKDIRDLTVEQAVAAVLSQPIEELEALSDDELVSLTERVCRRLIREDTVEYRHFDGEVRRSLTARVIQHPRCEQREDGVKWIDPLDNVPSDADGHLIVGGGGRNVAEDRLIERIDKQKFVGLVVRAIAAIGRENFDFFVRYTASVRKGVPKTDAERQRYHRLRKKLEELKIFMSRLSDLAVIE